MSIIDQEEVPLTNWIDFESDLQEMSSTNSTLELGVFVCSPSANTIHVRALEVVDSSAMGPAPIRAIWWVTYHLKRQNPVKGGILQIRQFTQPLKASLHHLFCVTVRSPWVKGGVWDERG